MKSIRRDGENIPWVAEQTCKNFSGAVVWAGVTCEVEDGVTSAQMAPCFWVWVTPTVLSAARCNSCQKTVSGMRCCWTGESHHAVQDLARLTNISSWQSPSLHPSEPWSRGMRLVSPSKACINSKKKKRDRGPLVCEHRQIRWQSASWVTVEILGDCTSSSLGWNDYNYLLKQKILNKNNTKKNLLPDP